MSGPAPLCPHGVSQEEPGEPEKTRELGECPGAEPRPQDRCPFLIKSTGGPPDPRFPVLGVLQSSLGWEVAALASFSQDGRKDTGWALVPAPCLAHAKPRGPWGTGWALEMGRGSLTGLGRLSPTPQAVRDLLGGALGDHRGPGGGKPGAGG